MVPWGSAAAEAIIRGCNLACCLQNTGEGASPATPDTATPEKITTAQIEILEPGLRSRNLAELL